MRRPTGVWTRPGTDPSLTPAMGKMARGDNLDKKLGRRLGPLNILYAGPPVCGYALVRMTQPPSYGQISPLRDYTPLSEVPRQKWRQGRYVQQPALTADTHRLPEQPRASVWVQQVRRPFRTRPEASLIIPRGFRLLATQRIRSDADCAPEHSVGGPDG